MNLSKSYTLCYKSNEWQVKYCHRFISGALAILASQCSWSSVYIYSSYCVYWRWTCSSWIIQPGKFNLLHPIYRALLCQTTAPACPTMLQHLPSKSVESLHSSRPWKPWPAACHPKLHTETLQVVQGSNLAAIIGAVLLPFEPCCSTYHSFFWCSRQSQMLQGEVNF